MTPPSTPRELGYRWPAEWECHAATWLAWPHNPETWPDCLTEATAEFVQLATTLARYEPVHVLAGGEQVMRAAKRWLGDVDGITLWNIPTNDAWIRDYGPIFLQHRGQTAIVDWNYNAWGGKYPPFEDDAAATRRIRDELGMPTFSTRVVLEGGSVEGNGQGVLLTTRSCLLRAHRNPHLTQPEIEDWLRSHVASDQVIWLDGEIAGDDTDGHIDQLVRFLAPNVVAVATETNQDDVNFSRLAQLRRQVANATLSNGQHLKIVELPMPLPIYQGRCRLPASYANFYVANGVVVVPQFNDAQDACAQEILREQFPDRDVLGLPCRALVHGLGSFHCLTQQQPAHPQGTMPPQP